MPTRMIREGILTSERVNALSSNAELFYRRLMSVADDHGRFAANLSLLRASCYPLKLDSVKEDSIKKHLAECVAAGLVVPYTVEGKSCLQLVDFGQRVQSKSKYPEPPEGALEGHGGSPGKTALGEGEGEGEGGDGERQPASAAVLEAYHRILPACQRVEVLNDKRKKRIAAAIKLAKQVCRDQGWNYVGREFWSAYFTECLGDEWLRGDKPHPTRKDWKQNLDVLLAEDRFAGIMDRAIAAMRAQS